MVPGRVLNQTGCPGCQGDEKDVGLHANPGGTQGSGWRRCARIGQADVQVRERDREHRRGERAAPEAGGGKPDQSLTERWARPPARGRRHRRGRLVRPRRISPPSRGSGTAAAAPAAGSPHVSPLPRNCGRRRITLPWQRPRRVSAGRAAAAAVPGTGFQAHPRPD